jgi:Cft2 family RNA processing exonuclease
LWHTACCAAALSLLFVLLSLSGLVLKFEWFLSKVSNIATDQMLYTEQDLETSMDKIETINFHEEKEVNGIKFW